MRCDVALSFGYPAPSEQRSTPRPQGRVPYDEVVHNDRW
jgi:hypothetical protein